MRELPHYRRIADDLRRSLLDGPLAAGDRMISARRLAAREQVSLPTAVEALRVLECEGLVVARPRSGWFVAPQPSEPPSSRDRGVREPRPVTLSALARSLFSDPVAPLVPLGAAVPDPDLLPTSDLARHLAAAGRRLGGAAQGYSLPPGRLDLRRRIALAAAEVGCALCVDEVVITSGATQGLHLALDAVTRPGDVVAVESPTYFGTLLALERVGLQALEIPIDPVTGLDPQAVAEAVDRHRVAAVVASPTVHNPTGATMPVAARRRLVEDLAVRGVPLIEDDVYGDLADEPRPPPCKAFDRDGGVILVSSVSKTSAPGWRIGWVAAGRWSETVLAHRFADSWAGSPLFEAALAAHLASGDHERHLRRLRTRLDRCRRAVGARIEAAFPSGTRVSAPAAGLLLWLELPEGVDALEVHAHALAEGIGVSPGHLFSVGGEYRRHLRINVANRITPALLRAIDRLGEICRDRADRGGRTG